MRKKKVFNFCILIILLFNICLFSFSSVIATDNIQNLELNSSNNFESSTNESTQDELNLSAPSAILVDKNTSKVLYEKNSKDKMYPASTTKLLTAILVSEKCADLSQKAEVSYYAVHSVPYSYSIANLQPGESISLKDLLNVLLIASANDAAYVLAEYVANGGNNYNIGSSQENKNDFNKSIEEFSSLMNDKAKELGCENSNFVNPNGIQNEKHYSTAYDLSLIGKYAYDNSTIRNIVSQQNCTLPNNSNYTGEERTFRTTNILLRNGRKGYYEYANGLKTGYTDAAQYCIIASAEKESRGLIAVVLHSDNTTNPETSRESDCKKLFEYGFNEFTNTTLVHKNEIIRNIHIINGTSKTNTLTAVCSQDLNVLVKKGDPIDITPNVTLNTLLAPIAKDQVIGKITYQLDGISYSADLIAEHDVYESKYRVVILVILIIFVLFLIQILLFGKKKQSKRKRKKRKY